MSDAYLGRFPETDDAVIGTPFETIKQLASELRRPVAVMDRRFNVLYANETACMAGRTQDTPAKCYEVFAQRIDSCENCPAIEVFESRTIRDIQSLRASACGLQRVYPLSDGSGQVSAVLACFDTSSGRNIRMPNTAMSERRCTGFGDLIGQSTVMQQLFDMIARIASSHASVLIEGESGTGKELVAKTIHRHSDRRHRPFVVVDCGSLPQTLLESELFGHMKGSFTGAMTQKRGLFEEADGGTIFLDEIADTSPTFQAKLLRALQEKEIKRVGGNKPIKIDVRVISATNKDLNSLIQRQAFRHDLYYRLAVLPIQLPPLRARRDDIPLLVRHFVSASCRRHGEPVREIPQDVMHVLANAEWPGNVRELQHWIERAVVTTSGPRLAYPEPNRHQGDESTDLRSVARHAARQAERARIVQALSETSGNRMRAAKALKISRASLYNKLREFAISS
ncbi:MAG TPA: sigma-54 dependent transcriptional regulator [Nitrospira sp.]|nr:sigma-54 dependent transcriptional regulator [Nitrospira sp.]